MNFIKAIPEKEKFECCLLENNLSLLHTIIGTKIKSIKKVLESSLKEDSANQELFLYSGGSFIINTDIMNFEIATSFHFNSLLIHEVLSNELLISDSLYKSNVSIVEDVHYIEDNYFQKIEKIILIKLSPGYFLHRGKPNNIGILFEFKNGEHFILGHQLDRKISSVGIFHLDDIREKLQSNLIFEDIEEFF